MRYNFYFDIDEFRRCVKTDESKFWIIGAIVSEIGYLDKIKSTLIILSDREFLLGKKHLPEIANLIDLGILSEVNRSKGTFKFNELSWFHYKFDLDKYKDIHLEEIKRIEQKIKEIKCGGKFAKFAYQFHEIFCSDIEFLEYIDFIEDNYDESYNIPRHAYYAKCLRNKLVDAGFMVE